VRGLGGGGRDDEPIYGISRVRGGQSRACDSEERAAVVGANGEEWERGRSFGAGGGSEVMADSKGAR
jgi:hypothetical protein